MKTNLFIDLIKSFDPSKPTFSPTEIYNEGWLIKIVLSLASSIPPDDFLLSFLPGSNWFSEAQLPTAFKASSHKDSLSEARTNADGVIGHFSIGNKAKTDFELNKDAKQFTVVEAKINSQLANGVKNAPDFDQAARNVACMAESLAQADQDPSSLERLDFIVLAPEKAIIKGTFAEKMTIDNIQLKTQNRVDSYQEQKKQWFQDRFIPTKDRIQLHTLSWEDTIDWLCEYKPEARDSLLDFYSNCLEYN